MPTRGARGKSSATPRKAPGFEPSNSSVWPLSSSVSSKCDLP
ncbi:MAG: hypothetical protein ACJ79S_02365 [Gemmatimonadaceae bacterium]